MSARARKLRDHATMKKTRRAADASAKGARGLQRVALGEAAWLKARQTRDAYNSAGLRRDRIRNQRYILAGRQVPHRRALLKSALLRRKDRFRRTLGWGRPELGVLPSRAMGYVV